MQDPIYAIPDIHGQDGQLSDALALIERDGGKDARIVFLGDLVDRGPMSQAVIERLRKGQSSGRDWIILRGNHDQMFLDFLDHGRITSPHLREGLTWLHPRLGGMETLSSYASDMVDGDPEKTRGMVPLEHRDWLARLPLCHQTDDLIFVHAGVRPGITLPEQDPEDMMWIREGFLEHTEPHPKLIVHGHTALDHPRHHGNRINLDGGAGWGRTLWPAVFERSNCWLLTPTGRVPLAP